ncbi:MAG: BON domain-containing protein [Kofleriaceae bacterium]
MNTATRKMFGLRGSSAVISLERTLQVMAVMKADAELKYEIEHVLACDPKIDDTSIGVSVQQGVVTLSGTVDSWAGKEQIEKAVFGVNTVRAVANEIEIVQSWAPRIDDTDIAIAARDAFRDSCSLAHDKICVSVTDQGDVRLTGSVCNSTERELAESLVRKLDGVRWVTNELAIRA